MNEYTYEIEEQGNIYTCRVYKAGKSLWAQRFTSREAAENLGVEFLASKQGELTEKEYGSDYSAEGRGLQIAAQREQAEKFIKVDDTEALKAEGCEQRTVKEAAYQTYDFEAAWDCPEIEVKRWYSASGKRLEINNTGTHYKIEER